MEFFWRMLKGPGLKSSGLYISVFQDRPNWGTLNMFKNMFEKSYKIRKKVENGMCGFHPYSKVCALRKGAQGVCEDSTFVSGQY